MLTFEPSPQKATHIRRRLNASGLASQIRYYSQAVSNIVGTTTFWSLVGGPEGSEQDSLSKPLRTSSQDLVNTSVPVTTVDAALDELASGKIRAPPSVLWAKIDAQGHDGKVVLGARQTIRAGRLPTFVMEVSPRLAPDGLEHYMRAFELLDRHSYRCFDCDTSGHAVMRWMSGVRFPSKEASYATHSRLRDLYNHSVVLFGENQGGWTNVVCTTERRLWGGVRRVPW